MKRNKRGSGWQNCGGYSNLMDWNVEKRMPPLAPCAFAEPGMVVNLCNLTGGSYGVIVAMTGALCIVQQEDGQQHALSWTEVEISHVAPNPKFLVPETTPAERNAIRRNGGPQ